MGWFSRLLMIVGALMIIYFLVVAGRQSAGVQVDLWGRNPQSVCNHPAGQPSSSPPTQPPFLHPSAPSVPTDGDLERWSRDYVRELRR